MKSEKSYILCIEQEKSLKKNITIEWIQSRYNTKMNTIFINSRISKTSDRHILLLNHSDKIDLRRKDTYITLSNLSVFLYMEKYKKVI